MRVLQRRWADCSRGDEFRLYPLADAHVGASDCDEKRLAQFVQTVKNDDNGYWLDLGDSCEFINRNDKRFSVEQLADWMTLAHMADIAKAQRDRYLDIVRPIADKCLGLVLGNHELVIRQRYERDVHLEIVNAIKQWQGLDADEPLSFGVTGWLVLLFSRAGTKHSSSTIRISLHHGFVGGKLMGAKALNMQRWLWSHECDLALMGHCHVVEVQPEWVEAVRGTKIVKLKRVGAFCGSFKGMPHHADTYVQHRGFFPQGPANVVINLRPGADCRDNRIKVVV